MNCSSESYEQYVGLLVCPGDGGMEGLEQRKWLQSSRLFCSQYSCFLSVVGGPLIHEKEKYSISVICKLQMMKRFWAVNN